MSIIWQLDGEYPELDREIIAALRSLAKEHESIDRAVLQMAAARLEKLSVNLKSC